MQQQPCSSESRAFFVIDQLSAGCLVWTKKALSRLCSTLAVSLKQPCPIGLGVLQQSRPGQPVSLQILLRLGPTFQAREFLTCINRLPPASATAGSNSDKLSGVLTVLIQHLHKLPARPDCHSHLFILSSSFAGCVPDPKMTKLLQFVSLQQHYSIHFLQLTGPEAELQAAVGADDGQPGASRPGGAAAADLAFLQMLQGTQSAGNFTYDALVADCDAATDIMCQSWLRDLLTAAHGRTTTTTSSGGGGSLAKVPDLVLRFGSQALPCSTQQHILQLDPWVLPAHACPCHHVPMQPCTNSSSLAAAQAAAAAASSDAGSMAALLMLPEACPWSCSISGLPVMAPLSSCPTDARILQLGRHTQLTMPTEAAAAAQAASSSSNLNRLQALPMAPGHSCHLEALHMVHPSAVDSMLLYGMPLLLTPCASSGSSDHQALGLLQDVSGSRDHQQGQQLDCLSASEAGMLMRALCQLLQEQQQVLLACSSHDLLRRIQLPPGLRQWYMLQPATDGSGLLLRWVASREQLLPPLRRDSSALGGTVGCAAAAAGEGFASEVVLLDAEQLEAVRDSLASLKGFGGSASSGGCSSANCGSSDDQGGSSSGSKLKTEEEPDYEAAEVRLCGDGAAAADTCGDAALSGQHVVQPLLLSCGLDEWVAAVLGASSATYTPPAFDPTAAVPPAGQYLQQGGPTGAAAAATIAAGAAAAGTAAMVHMAGPGAAQQQQLMQRPQHEGHAGASHAAGGTGQQSGVVPVGGGVGQPVCWPQPAAAGACPPAAAAGTADHQHQEQHAGQAEGAGAAAVSGSRAAGGGRGNGRGRRNSNAAAASGRKLRLSKV